MTKILVIVPAYNEEGNILTTCQALDKCSTAFDYIVINDASTDKTKMICQMHNLPHVNLILNLGIGGAVQTGYKYALENDYDVAVQYDGDGQHNVECLKLLIEPIAKAQVDLCIGSRFVDRNSKGYKSTRLRQIGIKIISLLIKLLTGVVVFDPTSGFRACNKTVIKLFAESYPVEFPEPESIVRLTKEGLAIKEISVEMNSRREGISSISGWKSIYYMVNVCLAIFMERIRSR